MRWAKCWARKSPAYVKNLGNIRVENLPILAGKKSAEILLSGAHSLSDQHSVKSCLFLYFNAVIYHGIPAGDV